MTEPIYTVERIADNSYRLDECGVCNCYLLIGAKKALLIDTCLGIGRLREKAEELTNLPLDVVLTHAHCDHAGGVNGFDRYYVHQADRAKVYGLLSSRFAAKLMTPKGRSLQRFEQKAIPVSIQDGYTFDLGGRRVRVISVPGHTRGSIALADEGEGLLLTGDDCNESLWMQLPGATTLAGWLPGGRRLLTLAKDYEPWCGHGAGRQSLEQMEQTYRMVEKLAQGRNGFPHTAVYPQMRTFPQVVYNTGKLHGKEKSE